MNKMIEKTPLYAEDLLQILNRHAMGIAGFDGSCERFVKYDAVVKGLQELIASRTADQAT